MNEATQLPTYEYEVDPYVLGSLIGDGCFTKPCLEFSTGDVESAEELARLLIYPAFKCIGGNYSYTFTVGKTKSGLNKRLQVKDLLQQVRS